MNDLINKLNNSGIPVDMLGQPIYKGDIILCKSYGSCSQDTFAKVLKVNKKSVQIVQRIRCTHYGKYHPKPANHFGHWDFYPDFKVTYEEKPVLKKAWDTLKVSQEFLDTAEARFKAVVDKHPEILI
jgi:hypothetical protein